jgi:hypothetical protein
MAAVQKHRERPKNKQNSKTSQPLKIITPAGINVVSPKPGQTVLDLLMAAAEQLRKKSA